MGPNGAIPTARLTTLITRYIKAIDTKTQQPIYLTTQTTNPTPLIDH